MGTRVRHSGSHECSGHGVTRAGAGRGPTEGDLVRAWMRPTDEGTTPEHASASQAGVLSRQGNQVVGGGTLSGARLTCVGERRIRTRKAGVTNSTKGVGSHAHV